MKVYNTLSRQKEDFKPIDDKEVRIYSAALQFTITHILEISAHMYSWIYSGGFWNITATA